MLKNCKTKFCRNKAAANRKYCHRCSKRKWAQNNPIKYAYNNLRTNAKRRGKVFKLSFEEFKDFVIKTDYMYGKGKSRMSLHIDRIREDEGYTLDNIQVLTNETNIKKYLEWKWNEEGGEMKFITKTNKVINNGKTDDCPF